MPDKQFPKTNRLLKSSEFKKVFRQGRKVVTATLVFHVMRTTGEEPRLGLAVSRKVGGAVKRNRVKRRIREAFRENKNRFEIPCDIVAYPRKGIADKRFGDFLESFEVLMSGMQKSGQRGK